MATDKLILTYADYGGEKSAFQCAIDVVTAANFDALVTAIANLQSGIGLVTDGLEIKRVANAMTSGSGQGSASLATAQRELKWLISYSDDVTGNFYQMELPCPTLTTTLLSDTKENYADLTAADWVTFIGYFEIVVKSPIAGNAVTVETIRLRGRNN